MNIRYVFLPGYGLMTFDAGCVLHVWTFSHHLLTFCGLFLCAWYVRFTTLFLSPSLSLSLSQTKLLWKKARFGYSCGRKSDRRGFRPFHRLKCHTSNSDSEFIIRNTEKWLVRCILFCFSASGMCCLWVFKNSSGYIFFHFYRRVHVVYERMNWVVWVVKNHNNRISARCTST